MAAWTKDELSRIGEAEELEIAPRRRDGSLRRPVPIWVVRAGEDLYVRSYRGRGGAWFRAAVAQGAGRIQAGGITKEVALTEEADPGVNDQVDAAYRSKYRRYGGSYTDTMVAPGVRATTLKLTPRA